VLHGDDLSPADAVDAHQPCPYRRSVHGTGMLYKRLAMKVQTPYLHVEAYFNPRFERPNHKYLTTVREIEVIVLLKPAGFNRNMNFGNWVKLL
jgi:hypothetical protein